MTVHLISLVIALMCAGSAYASPAPPARCEKIKLSAASTVADHLFRCFAKAVGTGHAVDNACLTAANARLAKAFTTAEARLICSFTGESTVVGARVTALAGNLAGAMGTGPSACDRKKLLAAGERATTSLSASPRALRSPSRLATAPQPAMRQPLRSSSTPESRTSSTPCAGRWQPSARSAAV
jgi:hypothetical protein